MALSPNIKRGSRKFSTLGRLNRKVAIYTVTETSDSQGGATESGSLTRTVWANVEPLTGTRAKEYSQITSGKGYRITMIKPSDITISEGNYLIYDSRTLAVHSVISLDEEDYYLEIIAEEKA